MPTLIPRTTPQICKYALNMDQSSLLIAEGCWRIALALFQLKTASTSEPFRAKRLPCCRAAQPPLLLFPELPVAAVQRSQDSHGRGALDVRLLHVLRKGGSVS